MGVLLVPLPIVAAIHAGRRLAATPKLGVAGGFAHAANCTKLARA